MKVFVLAVLTLTGLATASKSKRANAETPSMQWVTDASALKYLTSEMSDMDTFKSSLLRPLVVERVPGTAGNKAVQEHIKSLLKTWHIEVDHFTDNTPYGVKEFTNIIATFDPSKPTKIVLACHFDSKYIPNQIFVGATDSAVPCGILLETSRQLQCLLEKGSANNSNANDLTLQLIFFDGEEAFRSWTATDSIYGARHLANLWSVQSDPIFSNITRIAAIRYFILLDLLGTTDTVIPQQFTSTSELYQHLVKAEQYLRTNHYLTGSHSGPIFNNQVHWGGIEDDHKPFLQKGMNVLHLISDPFPSVWHEPSDDWAHLDFYLIDDFSRIFRVFISNLLHLQPENRGCRKK